MTAMKTFFAPAERATPEEMSRQATLFRDPLAETLLDMVHDFVLVLNLQRQVVYANRKMLRFLGLDAVDGVLGARPGEILHCQHAASAPNGCGTSEACSLCGALQAVLKALEGESAQRECRIMVRDKGEIKSFDMDVYATRHEFRGEPFVVAAMQDISGVKRRQALERIFLHDILNSAGGLRNLVEVLAQEAPASIQADAQLVHSLFSGLVEEIVGQRTLLAAESGELALHSRLLHSGDVLKDQLTALKHHKAAVRRTLQIQAHSEDLDFQADEVLLRRVLANMTINALEATPKGGTVTLGCRGRDGEVVFSAHNAAGMEREVQLQVFQRSFSTKGEDRGLGTYSIKLLTENFLKGKAWFTSNEAEGTTFFIALPRNLPQ